MADAASAVRRTPNPTRAEDHQTPETAAPVAPGATNPGGPVSQDAENVSGELRAEVSEVAEALAELRGKIHATAVLGHVHTTDDDMQAFLELPDCEACGGTGKDDHGSPFEAPLAVHFVGPPVEIAGRRRQLCMWCGHVLRDSPRAGDNAMQPWPVGALVRIEDGIGTLAHLQSGDELPPGCCALPDDEPVDPVDGYAADPCGKHTGRCSNRCLLPADHAGECDDDPPKPGPRCYPPADGWDGVSIAADDGPNQAQETRGAADWPPEPVDQRWDEREPLATDPGDAIDGGGSEEDGDDGA